MLLTRLLNACHHFTGFVYMSAKFFEDTSHIEIMVQSRIGSRSICYLPKPGSCYDHLAVRRFEFIPVWGMPYF